MSKKFKEASEVYQECLDIINQDIENFDHLMLAGINQMLGNVLKKSQDKRRS